MIAPQEVRFSTLSPLVASALPFPATSVRECPLENQSTASPSNLMFPTTKAQIPIGAKSGRIGLMHSGVFKALCRPRGRGQSEAFRDCLPAELGVTDAGNEGIDGTLLSAKGGLSVTVNESPSATSLTEKRVTDCHALGSFVA
jgi:hypothetical protein